MIWRVPMPSVLYQGCVATIRRYKITGLAVVLLAILSAYAVILMVEQAYFYWSPFFRAQSSSIIFFSLVYVGVAVQLVRRSVSDLETFSIALATTLSAIWFYELVYHYSFIGYFNFLKYPFFDFRDTSTTNHGWCFVASRYRRSQVHQTQRQLPLLDFRAAFLDPARDLASDWFSTIR